MKFENTKVFNIEGALRGMRNPLESWDKSDSLGPKDIDLAQRLIAAGSEHSKFLRQIFVSVDITAPLYLYKEFDTYKIGTTANSTSTMHTIHKNPISLDNFETGDMWLEGEDTFWNNILIPYLNTLRQNYLDTKDKKFWKELIRLLPEAWLQTRTWTANYAVLRNIYFQRRNHKLTEWHTFCEWIESLPYAKELITYEGRAAVQG